MISEAVTAHQKGWDGPPMNADSMALFQFLLGSVALVKKKKKNPITDAHTYQTAISLTGKSLSPSEAVKQFPHSVIKAIWG